MEELLNDIVENPFNYVGNRYRVYYTTSDSEIYLESKLLAVSINEKKLWALRFEENTIVIYNELKVLQQI